MEYEKGIKKDIKGNKMDEKGKKNNLKGKSTYLKGTKKPGGKGIHIGYSLGRLLKMQGIPVAVLANKLGINPKNAHAMLKKKYLHAATMVKISEVLNHDIIQYLYLPENLPGNAVLMKRMEEMKKEMEALKKENVMLSEMNRLLKRKG